MYSRSSHCDHSRNKTFFYYHSISNHYHIKSRLSKATTLLGEQFLRWSLPRRLRLYEVCLVKKTSLPA